MKFINEFISEGDFVKYGMAEIDRRYSRSDLKPHWTISIDREVYLRQVVSGRGELAGENTYVLHWKGSLIKLKLRESRSSAPDFTALRDYSLLALDLPPNLEAYRTEILADLKDALIVRNGAGVYSSGIPNKASFHF